MFMGRGEGLEEEGAYEDGMKRGAKSGRRWERRKNVKGWRGPGHPYFPSHRRKMKPQEPRLHCRTGCPAVNTRSVVGNNGQTSR